MDAKMDTTPGAPLLIVGSSAVSRTYISALRPEDGLALWTHAARGILADLVCHEGVVFVATCLEHRADPTEPAFIFALRASDGAELWRIDPQRLSQPLRRERLAERARVSLAEFSLSSGRWAANQVRFAGRHALATDGDSLIASGDAMRLAFDAKTGALRWVTRPARSLPKRPLAMCEGRAYILGQHNEIAALDARTGATLWVSERLRIADPVKVVMGKPVLFASGENPTLHRTLIMTLRVADGALADTFDAPTGRPEDQEKIAAIGEDGLVYLARQMQLRAVRLSDGQEVWQARPFVLAPGADSSDANSLGVVLGERLVVCLHASILGDEHMLEVNALDRASGRALWQWRSPKHALQRSGGGPPVIAFGNVYLFFGDRQYALSGSDGRLLWEAPAATHLLRVAPIYATGVNR